MRYPPRLAVAAAAVAAFAAVPLAYIAARAFGAPMEVWARLWTGQIPRLLGNSLALVATTVALTAGLGLTLAWLVERTDLPGRKVWRWLLALPLAIPAYVGAACYIIVLQRGGLLERAVMRVAGAPQGALPLPDLYTLWGATAVIGLLVYPYVYLPAAAALRMTDRRLDEAARLAGRSAPQTFFKVTLPLLLPPLAAGSLLVALYVLSDFGTVSMMRYFTFTNAIYNQFAGQIDRSSAAALSLVLIAISAPLLLGESAVARRDRRLTSSAAWRPLPPRGLGPARWVALAFAALVAFTALGLPLLVFGGLSISATFFPTAADAIWRVGNDDALRTGLNSLLTAGASATLAVLVALAPAHLATRFGGRPARALLALSKVSFALPGLIVALSLVMLFNQAVPVIYGTVAGVVVGYVCRLLPQSASTTETALRGVPPSLEQAARTLGCTPRQAFFRVTLRVAAPGMLASWTLVFITAMKELPTIILLRPPGFDTLPVRIWSAARESVYTQAALPALILIALTMVPVALLYSRRPSLSGDAPREG